MQGGPIQPLPAPGHMGVDYETRVDFDRLRPYRLDRVRKSLTESECASRRRRAGHVSDHQGGRSSPRR